MRKSCCPLLLVCLLGNSKTHHSLSPALTPRHTENISLFCLAPLTLSKGLWLGLTVSTVGITIGSGVRCAWQRQTACMRRGWSWGERGRGGRSEGYSRHHTPPRELMWCVESVRQGGALIGSFVHVEMVNNWLLMWLFYNPHCKTSCLMNKINQLGHWWTTDNTNTPTPHPMITWFYIYIYVTL